MTKVYLEEIASLKRKLLTLEETWRPLDDARSSLIHGLQKIMENQNKGLSFCCGGKVRLEKADGGYYCFSCKSPC